MLRVGDWVKGPNDQRSIVRAWGRIVETPKGMKPSPCRRTDMAKAPRPIVQVAGGDVGLVPVWWPLRDVVGITRPIESYRKRTTKGNQMNRTDPVLAVQRAMTPDEQRDFLDRIYRTNPNMKGAHVADVLDIIYGSDGAIQWTEPFWEKYGESLTTDSEGDFELLAYVVIALAVIVQAEPSRDIVVDLLTRSRKELAGGN